MKHLCFLFAVGITVAQLQAHKFKFYNQSSKPAWVVITTRTQKIFTIPSVLPKESAEIDTGSHLAKTIQLDKSVAFDYGEKPEGATYYIKDTIRTKNPLAVYGGRYVYKEGDMIEQKVIKNNTAKIAYIDVGPYGPGLVLEPNMMGILTTYGRKENVPVYANSMLDMPLIHIPAGNFWCRAEWKNIDNKSIIKVGKKLSPTSMGETPDHECIFEKAP